MIQLISFFPSSDVENSVQGISTYGVKNIPEFIVRPILLSKNNYIRYRKFRSITTTHPILLFDNLT